ncbi:hypothetical protein SeLEV6574_g06744 [Synchytrium endobioticum]|nr:hypothetical protein SeLEV6574_g06744 [Synchytrium endobioticum]
MFSQTTHNMPPNNGEETRLEDEEDDLLSYDGSQNVDHATGLGDGLQVNPMAPPFILATSSSVPSARVPLGVEESTYFRSFEVENAMVLDRHKLRGQHKWVNAPLDDLGTNWASWCLDLDDAMVANRLTCYSKPELCNVIREWKDDKQSTIDKRLYYLHRERMVLLKNLIKMAISSKHRSAEILERLKSNFEIRSDSTKQELIKAWNALGLHQFATFQEYLARERNLVDAMTSQDMGLDELVTNDIRVDKLMRTISKTPAGLSSRSS